MATVTQQGEDFTINGDYDLVFVNLCENGEYEVINANDYVYGSAETATDAIRMAEYYADNDIDVEPDVDEATEWADFDPDC